MNLPEDFVFTQGNLQDYVDCPRRFELKYLRRQRWPAAEVDDMAAFERYLEQGASFHRLVQQSLLGLSPETLRPRIEDDEVAGWYDAWLANGLADVPSQRWPELTLTAPLGKWLLLAKMDLVAIAADGRALLLDWKTGRRKPRPARLAERLQTRVYRYVLARAGARLNGGEAIDPARIEMRYWYAQHEGDVLRFPYDAEQYRADDRFLRGLAREIDRCEAFPLTEDVRRCRFCVYRSLCGRGERPGPLEEWEGDEDMALPTDALDIDALDEIAF
ncbi:MAG: PD-(D/E)XK nuclease family protein [Anaerolineaceae bacterium]|nr:PD-(D/E)XK nuclease family protein [Anaerolineaceae bacterium]